MMVCGCLIMLLAANLEIYEVVLLGLFVMASGITILQVAANPLAAALGAPERSHFRLTFSQAFNSLGTFIGPYLGASLFLKGVEVKEGMVITPAVRAASLHGIDRAFFWIAGLIILIGILIFAGRKMISGAAPPPPHETADVGIGTTIREAISSPWALFGGLAIFLYVGAEVAIGTQMALFLNSNYVWNVPLETAGKFVSLYWGGAMVGRLVGFGLADESAGASAIGCVHSGRLRLVPVRVQCGRHPWWLCRAMYRAVQFDHVPGDLHNHARAVDRIGGDDLGFPLLLDRRRRGDPAAYRAGLAAYELCDGIRRARDLLRGPVPVRDRFASRADSPSGRTRGRDNPLEGRDAPLDEFARERKALGPGLVGAPKLGHCV